jgi:CRP-like cAMP-binding protein
MHSEPSHHAGSELLRLGTSHRYRCDTVLFEQHQPAEAVYLIEDGLVKVSRAEENGSQVLVALRGPGSLLGDASAILADCHSTSAQAITNCLVRQIPATELRRHIKMDADLSWCIHVLQSHELQNQAARVASIGGLPARRRLEGFLAWALDHQSVPTGSARRIMPALRRSELAAILVTTPEHLSRLLTALEGDGLIRREHGWLIAVRPEDLARRRGTSTVQPF